MLRNLVRVVTSPPPAAIAFTSALLLALAALADQLTPRAFGVEVFYLLAVVLAAWYLDRTWALGFGVVAAGAWLFLDLVSRPADWDPVLAVWNALTRLVIFLGVGVLTGMLKGSVVRGEALARVDDVTGARNAVAFYEAARLEVERSRRSGSVLTAAFFDVPGLDELAASKGRGAADRLLKTVAEEMRSVMRSTDVIARLHDDVFAVLFPGTGRVEAAAVLLKVSERAQSTMRANEWDARLRMGAATFMRPPESVNEMRRALEDVQHAARERGRDVIEHQVFT